MGDPKETMVEGLSLRLNSNLLQSIRLIISESLSLPMGKINGREEQETREEALMMTT